MLLAVERSGTVASAAVYSDDRSLLAFESARCDARGDAWPLVRGILSRAGAAPSDLNEFAVGTGPGSFSGIRAALALVQGLAAPRALPVRGGLSAAAAMRAWRRANPDAPRGRMLGDARRGHVWCFNEPDDYKSLSNTAADIVLYDATAAANRAKSDMTASAGLACAPQCAGLPPVSEAFSDGRSVILADEARLRPILAALGLSEFADAANGAPPAPPSEATDVAALFFAGASGPADPVYLHPAVASVATSSAAVTAL